MYKKSLFLGAAVLALLVLLAFVGCSNPSSGTTEYVAQASSEYPYPADTVVATTRAALDGLLNDYNAETNRVWHIAYRGAGAVLTEDLIIPTGKTVYLDNNYTGHAGNITVTEGAALVLVGTFNAGTSNTTGLLLVRGTVEVFRELTVTNDARDVADYTVESVINPGRNTVIGKKVTILPGATLNLVYDDIIPPDQYSENKFTPAQAWAAAGQGNLEVAAASGALLNPYPYTVKELLTGVAPSAARSYVFTSPRIAPETLPALIPQGAFIETSATPETSDGNTLTVNGFLATNGALKNITEITVGNGGALGLTQASGDVLDNLTKLTVGPGASFGAVTPNITLQSLETLFLGDGSSFTVDAGNSVTFTQAEGKKLLTTLGKKVFYSVGTAADAIVDVVIKDDASLITGSTLTVNPGSTFTLDAEKTLTVENGAVVDFSALTPPAAADPSPVIISGTIAIEAGGTFVGPALAGFVATPETVFDVIELADSGKVVLDWGADFILGSGTGLTNYVGDDSSGSTYEWVVTATDGAQIEINAAGLIIRDINGGSDAVVTVAQPNAGILKNQSLTLDTGTTLSIAAGNTLWLIGGTEPNDDGAVLKGAGKVVAQDTTIVGGPSGWRVIGDSFGIGVNAGGTESELKSGSASASVTTPAATLKALGSVLGASITQAATSGNNLTIAANTTIALGGSALKKVGELVLTGDGSNPGQITFANETSKITTGNNTTTTTTAGSLAIDSVTTVTSNTIDTIGVANLIGDKTPGTPLGATDPGTKVTTTAVVNTTDNDLMAEGKLAALSGKDTTYGGTIKGGNSIPNSGYINSETITNADTTT